MKPNFSATSEPRPACESGSKARRETRPGLGLSFDCYLEGVPARPARCTQGAGIGRKTASCRSWPARKLQPQSEFVGPAARRPPARYPKRSGRFRLIRPDGSKSSIEEVLDIIGCAAGRPVFPMVLRRYP